MFQIKNISKKYGSEYAIRDLSFNIDKGLNFIIGSSGSGKTTLLKIISGMDNQYEGDVLYLGESIKNLSEDQKSYYYNNRFGFIWQDINLIEDMTVEENILLPLHIKNVSTNHTVEKVLRNLKISKLKNQKVKQLSGGQKQRVAIARELVKNPQVIIADEPTSALDPKIAIEVMGILKEISKEKTVIVVTHDTSLLDKDSNVYELDKGELITKPEVKEVQIKVSKPVLPKNLKLSKAINVGMINNKSKLSRTFITCLSIIITSTLLMTSVSGSLFKSSEDTFDKLFESYGNSILDIMVVNSFTGAAGTDNESDEPNVDVKQDISGEYEKYLNDDRVEFLVFDKPFNDIKVSLDGKEYSIENSGTAPALEELLSGNIPKNRGEVVVPESFVKKLGISNEEVLGKEIDFNGSLYNWDSGNPVLKEVNIKAKIVGVANTTCKFVYDGISSEFELEDSFFFDKETLDDANAQADIKGNSHNFKMRVKSPEALIEVNNELNSNGIVPIGQFELVEDIVKLNTQTSSLSKGSTVIISGLAIAGLVSIALVTSIMRKREYAIYKVCGYSKQQLSKVLLAENTILSGICAVSLIVLSPVISGLTKIAFGTSISNIKTLSIGVIIVIVVSLICYIISSQIASNSKPSIVLKSGEK